MMRGRLAAVPRVALLFLFLFLCRGEGGGVPEVAGLSEGDEDMRATSGKKQQVLPRLGSADVLLERIKEPGRHGPDAEADVTPVPLLAFQLSVNHPADKRDTLSRPETSATSYVSKLRTEVTELGSKRSVLSDGNDGGVVDGHYLGPSSEEEAYSANGVGEVQPGRTPGGSERVEDPQWGQSPRRRRSWLWNQFFVIEEYRGPEPVLIGRRVLHSTSLLLRFEVCPMDCDISKKGRLCLCTVLWKKLFALITNFFFLSFVPLLCFRSLYTFNNLNTNNVTFSNDDLFMDKRIHTNLASC